MRTIEYACGCKVIVYPESSSSRYERCPEHKASKKPRKEIEKELKPMKVNEEDLEQKRKSIVAKARQMGYTEHNTATLLRALQEESK